MIDEWKDSYFGLPALLPLIRRVGPKFSMQDITDEDVYSIIGGERTSSCSWLERLSVRLLNNNEPPSEIKIEFIRALYLVGLIGIRPPSTHQTAYSFDKEIPPSQDLNDPEVSFVVHKMFHRALGMRDTELAVSAESA